MRINTLSGDSAQQLTTRATAAAMIARVAASHAPAPSHVAHTACLIWGVAPLPPAANIHDWPCPWLTWPMAWISPNQPSSPTVSLVCSRPCVQPVSFTTCTHARPTSSSAATGDLSCLSVHRHDRRCPRPVPTAAHAYGQATSLTPIPPST